MASKRDPVWNHVNEIMLDGVKKLMCKCCDKQIRGGVHRMKQHLAGAVGQISSCQKVPHDVQFSMQEHLKEIQQSKTR